MFKYFASKTSTLSSFNYNFCKQKVSLIVDKMLLLLQKSVPLSLFFKVHSSEETAHHQMENICKTN